ncbi:MAG: LysM domain-containing protein [Planctomycetota bacterium]|nr:LysM domain-containing protein [Planctomycetota bacterium]
MQNGDTLERIARKLFNDGRKWRELYEWNRDQIPDPGRLRVGQVLKIKQAGARTTAGTLPAAGAPRADADSKEAPRQAETSPAASASAEGGGGAQIMSSTSPANLP